MRGLGFRSGFRVSVSGNYIPYDTTPLSTSRKICSTSFFFWGGGGGVWYGV